MGESYIWLPTGAIVGPCVVIPDIGGRPTAYFEVKPRRKWMTECVDWLKSPHQPGGHNGTIRGSTDTKASEKYRKGSMILWFHDRFEALMAKMGLTRSIWVGETTQPDLRFCIRMEK